MLDHWEKFVPYSKSNWRGSGPRVACVAGVVGSESINEELFTEES